jgi:hypothetical protein
MRIFFALLAAATTFSANGGYCAVPAMETLDTLTTAENISVPAPDAPVKAVSGDFHSAGANRPAGLQPNGNFNPHPPHPAHWADTSCFYDGDNFRVIYHGTIFMQDVDDNFTGALCSGGWGAAGLYDGDDFFVFNGRTGKFDYKTVDDGYMETKISAGAGFVTLYDGDDFLAYNALTEKFSYKNVDDNVDNAVLKSGVNIAALYDGDDLVLYNSPTDSFSYKSVRDNVANPVMEIGTNVAAFYDGDDLIIYDQLNSRFDYASADDNYADFVIAAGKSSVLAYDGDDVIAYCSATKSFRTASADNGAWAQAYMEQNGLGADPGIIIGKDFFTVKPLTCEIQKQQFQRD